MPFHTFCPSFCSQNMHSLVYSISFFEDLSLPGLGFNLLRLNQAILLSFFNRVPKHCDLEETRLAAIMDVNLVKN